MRWKRVESIIEGACNGQRAAVFTALSFPNLSTCKNILRPCVDVAMRDMRTGNHGRCLGSISSGVDVRNPPFPILFFYFRGVVPLNTHTVPDDVRGKHAASALFSSEPAVPRRSHVIPGNERSLHPPATGCVLKANTRECQGRATEPGTGYPDTGAGKASAPAPEFISALRSSAE